MPFQIVHNDITRMHTDAIVNAANQALRKGGGVCGAIFRAAKAAELEAECAKKAPCPTGRAVITGACGLAARYIIHAVGPVWQGGGRGEAEALAGAYRHALMLAEENGCESVSFPLISAGIYGYPKEEALMVATETIREFLKDHEMEVYLVVFDRGAVCLSEELFDDVRHYINTYFEPERSRSRKTSEPEIFSEMRSTPAPMCAPASASRPEHSVLLPPSRARRLEELLSHMEESFTEMLLRLIDEKGYSDVEVYKRANMDRKLFSKIRGNREYHPKKATVLSLAVALRLSVDEAADLLRRAGYSFSNSSRQDIIVRYFLQQEEYDMFTINETLFCFEEPLLGA
ncbi:MAG: RNase III inhibitor [Lachnospiraceae bacterium]|jgi:O-acetyl-ADP-ribose deacetylase (regulator of RNase III)|nr:RNase III inhibitor [Lachnospiraceae bacterium]